MKKTNEITLEQAVEVIKTKETERQERVNEFLQLYKSAEEQTNCQVIVDTNSPLNDIRLIVVSKT